MLFPELLNSRLFLICIDNRASMETWKATCLCHTDMDVLFCYLFNYGECCAQICLLKASDNVQRKI